MEHEAEVLAPDRIIADCIHVATGGQVCDKCQVIVTNPFTICESLMEQLLGNQIDSAGWDTYSLVVFLGDAPIFGICFLPFYYALFRRCCSRMVRNNRLIDHMIVLLLTCAGPHNRVGGVVVDRNMNLFGNIAFLATSRALSQVGAEETRGGSQLYLKSCVLEW